jgi:TolB protein
MWGLLAFVGVIALCGVVVGGGLLAGRLGLGGGDGGSSQATLPGFPTTDSRSTYEVPSTEAPPATPAPGEPTVTLAPSLAPTDRPTATALPGGYEPFGHIVYTCYDGSRDQICIMNADGSGQRQLTDTDYTDYYPSLSPDGAQIVFASRRGSTFDIYIMDSDGRNVRNLTNGFGQSAAPDISPDGSRIVFASTSPGYEVQNIFVMNIDGSGITQLTFETEAQQVDPHWSPDGMQIAFASNRSGNNELYIINADGSGLRQLTSGAIVGGRSDWSPDGQHIAFYGGSTDNRQIWIVGVGGGGLQQLTFSGDNKAPSFSPDGEWIAFASKATVDDDNEIMILRLDTGELRQLTSNELADWQPRWGP